MDHIHDDYWLSVRTRCLGGSSLSKCRHRANENRGVLALQHGGANRERHFVADLSQRRQAVLLPGQQSAARLGCVELRLVLRFEGLLRVAQQDTRREMEFNDQGAEVALPQYNKRQG